MGESESDANRNESPPLGNKVGAVDASLLQSPLGIDALNAAKGFLLAGVPFQSAIRQAAVGALDRAGVCDDKVPHLEREIVSVVIKAILRPLMMKIVSPLEMTKSDVVEEIRAIGFEKEVVQNFAEVLWSKRERLREVVVAKVKANVLDRLKECQTETQGETLGRILDELFKGGVRASTNEEILAAWRKVKGSGNS
jgi:hypothetical protein